MLQVLTIYGDDNARIENLKLWVFVDQLSSGPLETVQMISVDSVMNQRCDHQSNLYCFGVSNPQWSQLLWWFHMLASYWVISRGIRAKTAASNSYMYVGLRTFEHFNHMFDHAAVT